MCSGGIRTPAHGQASATRPLAAGQLPPGQQAFVVGPGSIPLRQASRGVTQARWIDLGMRICPDLMCWPVIGDTLVYRDGDYLSTAYAASLAPALWRLFVRVAPATIPVPGMTTP